MSASTGSQKLQALAQTYIDMGGVDAVNLFDFEEDFLTLVTGLHRDILGNYGMLQFFVTLAKWRTLYGNILDDNSTKPMVEIPEAAGADPELPPAGSSAAIYSGYNVTMAARARAAAIRATLLTDLQTAMAIFVMPRLWGRKVADFSKGGGSPEEIALEQPLDRWTRVKAKLACPGRTTFDAWHLPWHLPMTDPDTWINNAVSTSRKLAFHNRDFTDAQKFDMTSDALAKNSATRAVWQVYKVDHPAATQQSFGSLCDFIEEQAENIKSEINREGAGYMTRAATAAQEVLAAAARAAPRSYTQQEYDEALAREPPQRRNRGRKQSVTLASGSAQRTRRPYCWLHGCIGHSGVECWSLQKPSGAVSDRGRQDSRGDRGAPLYIGHPGTISREDAQQATSAGQFPEFPGNEHSNN
jgi:hypothetical protein